MVTMFSGGRTATTGACPGCGDEVERVHAWSTGSSSDAYDCPACGPFTYGDGPLCRPLVFASGPAAAELVTIVAEVDA